MRHTNLELYNSTSAGTSTPISTQCLFAAQIRVAYGITAIPSAGAFTADAGTDALTKATHGLETGMKVQVSTTTTLPSPLQGTTDYWVIKTGANTFKLATTYAGAIAGTAIDIENAGTGTHTVTPQANSATLLVEATHDLNPDANSDWYTVKSVDLTSGTTASESIYPWVYGAVRASITITAGSLTSCRVRLFGKAPSY